MPKPTIQVPSPEWKQLVTTDYALARAGEDLILLLVAKGIITLAELPPQVQALVTLRQGVRQKGSPNLQNT